MNVYKKKNSKTWWFGLVVGSGPGKGGRRQREINTFAGNKRVAEEVMRKTALLAETVEAGMSLPPELHQWVSQSNPKLRKRLSALHLIESGLAAAASNIDEHVEAYLSFCRFLGHGANYESIKRSQLQRLFKLASIRRANDLTVERVQTALQWLKDQGRSHRTINQNRATVVAFANWLVEQEKLPHHRLNLIPRLNEDADRRLVRRAATEDELERFLASVPAHRRFVYTAALMTGLRRGELRRIERRDIDLKARTLTVRIEVSKAGRADVLPLHEDFVGLLAAMVAGLEPGARVFVPMPSIRTWKADLERAGVAFKDENGHQLDFHALRATFATRLLREGVPASVARRLTRHASVKTLERHYDRLGFTEAAEALQRMPGLGGDGAGQRSRDKRR